MAEDTGLIKRVDSLLNNDTGAADGNRREGSRAMNRRRSFLAAKAQTDTPGHVPGTTLPANDEDDLPVLTEVVLPAETAPAESLESIGARLRQELAAELAQRIDRQLSDQVPALVDAALQHVADRLQQAIGATVEAVLHDFIEQGEQARLHLPAPGSDEEAPPR